MTFSVTDLLVIDEKLTIEQRTIKMSVVYTANYLEDKARREAVVEMMRRGDWRGVMDSFHGGEEARDPLLVWVRPSITALDFIKKQINGLGLDSIASIGCGCGTLGEGV